MKINWKKYVDHIYIVDYVKTPANVTEHFNSELKRVGINRNDTSFVTTFMNINSPLYKVLYDNVKVQSYGEYSYAFDCTLAHYYCMKLAEASNYERILIFENDAIFYDDLKFIKNTLDKVLEGFQNNTIDLFCGNLGVINDNAKEIDYTNKGIYKYNYDVFCAGAAFNIYNKKTYSRFIHIVETQQYAVVDQYYNLYVNAKTQIYYSHIPVCVQKQWDFLMYNLFEHYNMLEPTEEQILSANENRQKIVWADKRNLHKIFYDVLEHYNLQDKYKDMYEDSKKHI